MKKRLHIYYNGHVHGVGFRFTAEHIALDYNITGWVKNLPDSRVELVCEGEELSIKNFTIELEKQMSAYISEKDEQWEQFRDEFKDFSIAYY